MKFILPILLLITVSLQAQVKLQKPQEDTLVIEYDTILVDNGIGMHVHAYFSMDQVLRDKLIYNKTESVLGKEWNLEQKSYMMDSCLVSQQTFDKKGRLLNEVYGSSLDGRSMIFQRIYKPNGTFKVSSRPGKIGGDECN